MTNSFRSQNHPAIVYILAAVGLLVIGDMISIYLFTDFWDHPAVLKTKLGIAGNEVISLFAASVIVLLPVLAISCFTKPLVTRTLLILFCIPLLLLLVGGWAFYAAFSKFIGLYVLQHAIQDGDQMIIFMAKMPSTINLPVLLTGAFLFIGFMLLPFGGKALFRSYRTSLSLIAICSVLVAVPCSLLWNQPYKQTLVGDESLDTKIDRIQASEFEILSAKSGPFAAFVNNISNYFFQDTSFEKLALPENTLSPRVTEKQLSDSIEKDTQVQYNIVYFLIESLRPDMLAAFGGDPEIMPNVNELSRTAYVFDDVWAQSSHSNYADVASLSGQYPLRSTNIHFYPKNPAYPRSLPYDMLKPAGYHTGIFSSQNEDWGLMSNYLATSGLDQFSHVGSIAYTEGAKLSKSNTGVKLNLKKGEDGKGKYSLAFEGFMYRSTGKQVQRLDESTANEALSWLQKKPADDPFFLYFNFQASHYPYNEFPKDFERRFLTGSGEQIDKLKSGITENMPTQLVASAYKDSLLYVDQNIGNIVSYLKYTGQHERTIYVISADTSMLLNSKLLGNGGELYPEVLKIPLILSTSRLDKSQLMNVRGEQIDIMPTVLPLSGNKAHPASQGVDLLRHFGDERVVYAVAQTPVAHQYSAVYKDWQLIHDYESGDNILRYLGTGEGADNEMSETKKQWLATQLQTWINAQLAYYANPSLHEQYFPPRFLNLEAGNDDKQPVIFSEKSQQQD